jgi:prepilin-type processing-associated H-X9-DG protein
VPETRCIDMGELAQVVAFYEASPAPDGTRAVLFLDGHVQVIPETEWPRLKRASGLP